jgi:hypothetical protein
MERKNSELCYSSLVGKSLVAILVSMTTATVVNVLLGPAGGWRRWEYPNP